MREHSLNSSRKKLYQKELEKNVKLKQIKQKSKSGVIKNLILKLI